MYASTFTIHLDVNCLLRLHLRFLFFILKLGVIDDKNVCFLVFALAQVPMLEKVVVGAQYVVYFALTSTNRLVQANKLKDSTILLQSKNFYYSV